MENKWIRATRNWMAANCANEWTLSPRMNMRSCQLHLFVFATAAWTGDDWWRLLLISHVCHLDYERIIAKIGWSKHATHTHDAWRILMGSTDVDCLICPMEPDDRWSFIHICIALKFIVIELILLNPGDSHISNRIWRILFGNARPK